jgi:NADH:ubiquinone oxidoreductase subunit
MAKISILGALSNIQMLIHTLFRGSCVGRDEFGNKYYRGKTRKSSQPKESRWVIYARDIEASQVPPQWHGWLHHQTDELPAEAERFRQPWQKPHQQNLTGTPQAYFPPGDPRGGGQRDQATGDYAAWRPPQ